MFIKKIDKSNAKTGKEYYTYRLCESYRIDGKVRHRTILNVGKLENLRREDFKALCDRIEEKVKGISPLFPSVPSALEKEAEYIYRRILNEKLLDCKANVSDARDYEHIEATDVRKVDVNSIKNEDSRSFGDEWLSKQMIDRCGLKDFLSQNIEDENIEKMIEAEIIARMIHPASELETSRWLEGESSLCEMLGLAKTPDHRKLYEAARRLYGLKDKVEDFLYQHFETEYPDRLRLCLYDLTNFYFEGRKEGSALAQFGRSKEKRSDAKLVSLGLLTNGRGFVRRSRIYKGNIGEPTTMVNVISELEASAKESVGLFDAKPVVVMDAGIATEENLKQLREKQFDYICVSRSSLSEYSIVGSSPVTVMDNRKNPIEIQVVKSNKKDDSDLYLYVKSEMKQKKEHSMSDKLTGRFLEDLENIKSSLSKKRGVKQEDKVNRRIGRLLQKYPSVSKGYKIELQSDENKVVTDIVCEKTGEDKNFGVYFIRCSQNRLTEELIWEIYNTLREIECTFRCLKTELDIRPVYHRKDISTEAHIFVGIVAYQLVHAIRQGLKKEKINHSWTRIRNIMSAQSIVTTRMKLENGDSLILRNPTRPNQEQSMIYRTLNFKHSNHKMRKKAVVPRI